MKKILILAVSFFVLFGCMETEKPKAKKTAPAPVIKDLTPKGWEYSTEEDKMDGSKRYWASRLSTNIVEFNFMNSKSWFRLTLRNMNKKNEIVLMMMEETAGQFMPSLFSPPKTCRFKFDNSPPVNFGYSSSTSDGSSNTIFFFNPQKLIANLKIAEKLMIECEFYQEGKKIIEFDVKGLEWNR